MKRVKIIGVKIREKGKIKRFGIISENELRQGSKRVSKKNQDEIK